MMNEYLGFQYGNKYILDTGLDFKFESNTDIPEKYLILNDKFELQKKVNGNELIDFFGKLDEKSFEKSNFSYFISQNDKFNKVSDVKNSFNDYKIAKNWELYGDKLSLEKNIKLEGGISSFLDFYAGDYRVSRSSLKQELFGIFKEVVEKHNKPEIKDTKIFYSEIVNECEFQIFLDYNGDYGIKLIPKVGSAIRNYFDGLGEYSDELLQNSELSGLINEMLEKNKDILLLQYSNYLDGHIKNFRKVIDEYGKRIETYKDKTILNNLVDQLNYISNEKQDVLKSFEQIVFSNFYKARKSLTLCKTMYGENSLNYILKNMDMRLRKACIHLGLDIHGIDLLNHCSYENFAKNGFKIIEDTKLLPSEKININPDLLLKEIDTVELKKQTKTTESETKTVLTIPGVQKVSVVHTIDENQSNLERSKRYVESIYNLISLKQLYEEITQMSLTFHNLDVFKDKVLSYKNLSEVLKNNYSGEGGLIITRDTIHALSTYISLYELGEKEKFFLLEFIQENTVELLKTVMRDEVLNPSGKISSILTNKINIISGINLSEVKLKDFLNEVMLSLDIMQDYQIDMSKINVQINNVDGRGSYYTPNVFSHLIEPFVKEKIHLGSVSVLDNSCGKGQLLSFIQAPELVKVGNDINPISVDVVKSIHQLEYDKILQSDSISEIKSILKSQNNVFSNTSLLNLFGKKSEFDYVFLNPPYIQGYANKKTKNFLKELGIKNVSQNGKVNLTEASFIGMLPNLKYGGIGMLISSARGISKIEEKKRLDENTFLVPLYRIGVSGDPFSSQGVKLAGIDIQDDDTYVLKNNELVKGGGTAEFFVTIYTKCNKETEKFFEKVCPTLLVDLKQMNTFGNAFSQSQLEGILFNHSMYQKINRKFLTQEVKDFQEKMGYLQSESTEKDILKLENIDVMNLVHSLPDNKFFSEKKSLTKKQLVEFSQGNTSESQGENDFYDLFQGINPTNISVLKEAILPTMNMFVLKNTLQKTYGIEFNGYGFTPGKKVINQNGKYFHNDIDITPLVQQPFPFCFHNIPLKTFSSILGKYFENISGYSNEWKNLVENIIDFYKSENVECFVIKEVGKIGFQSDEELVEVLSKFSLQQGENSMKQVNNFTLSLQEKYSKQTIEKIENTLLYLTSTNEIEKIKDPAFVRDLNKKLYKYFPKGKTIKLSLNSQNLNLNKLKDFIIQQVKNYSIEKGTLAFDEIFQYKQDPFSMLGRLSEIIVNEYKNGNDYFDIVELFPSKSPILSQFRNIVEYKNIGKIMKFDLYLANLDKYIDQLHNINDSLYGIYSKISKPIPLKFLQEGIEMNYNTKEIFFFNTSSLQNILIKYYIGDLDSLKNIQLSLERLNKDIGNVPGEVGRGLLQQIEILKNNSKSINDFIQAFSNIEEKQYTVKDYNYEKQELYRFINKSLNGYVGNNSLYYISIPDYKSELKSQLNLVSSKLNIDNNENYFFDNFKKLEQVKDNLGKKKSILWNEFMDLKLHTNIEKLDSSKSMLLNIYKKDVQNTILSEYRERASAIEEIIGHYSFLENRLQVLKSSSDEKHKNEIIDIEKKLNFSRFMVANMEDSMKILILDYMSKRSDEFSTFKQYLLTQKIIPENLYSLESFVQNVLLRFDDYRKYGYEFANSITDTLGQKSNYARLLSEVFVDIEKNYIFNEDNFSESYKSFRNVIQEISPKKEVIQKAKLLAQYIENIEILSQRKPLLFDLKKIDEIDDIIESELQGLNDDLVIEYFWEDIHGKKILKNLKQTYQQKRDDLSSELLTYVPKNNDVMTPTFAQSKALYHFYNTLEKNQPYNLINTSEVGTGKTFTMRFYNTLLDLKLKKESIKIIVTEANLVSNTRKALIENGVHPKSILEGKISTLDDVYSIQNHFSGDGGYLILSSHGLQNITVENLKIMCSYFKKYDKNIYLYADEATFLKNTESGTYQAFQNLRSNLEKTNKLMFTNYMTATPVNNDNGDFLYLFNAFNYKDKISLLSEIRNYGVRNQGLSKLYEVIGNLGNLKSGLKYAQTDDKGKPYAYYYIPNIVSFLEFIRIGSTNVNIDSMVEVPNKWDPDKNTTISLIEYYQERGINFYKISPEEYHDKDFIITQNVSMSGNEKDTTKEFIDIMSHLNIVNFDRNMNSISADNSKLFKTYFSLEPSILDCFLVETIMKEMQKIQNYKRFVGAIGKLEKFNSYEVLKMFREESNKIFHNLAIEIGVKLGLENTKSSYSESRKVKKGFSEVTQTTHYDVFSVKKDDIISAISQNVEGKICNSEFIDEIFMAIDIISYTHLKTSLNLIETMKSKDIKESIIMKEQQNAIKYFNNIAGTLGVMLDKKISNKTDVELIKQYVCEALNRENDFLTTFAFTYVDTPHVFLENLEVSREDTNYTKLLSLKADLTPGEGFSGFSDRKFIIQLLEDFNTPLVSVFTDKAIYKLIHDVKDLGFNLEYKKDQIDDLRNFILMEGNSLSGTLIEIGKINSEAGVNSTMMVGHVSTVENIYSNLKKSEVDTYKITGKDVPTSKEKLKIINDFDNLKTTGKVLISTTKSVEKGLSIFNSLKGYTTIGDENAGALTQRIGRFRVLMNDQLKAVNEKKQTVLTSTEYSELEKKKEINNLDNLLKNRKEFFVISNKLIEGLLNRSEQKNALLQKVNAHTMFRGIDNFNINSDVASGKSLEMSSILSSIEIIKNLKLETFCQKLSFIGEKLDMDNFSKTLKSSIKTSQTENIKKLEMLDVFENKTPNLEKLNINTL